MFERSIIISEMIMFNQWLNICVLINWHYLQTFFVSAKTNSSTSFDMTSSGRVFSLVDRNLMALSRTTSSPWIIWEKRPPRVPAGQRQNRGKYSKKKIKLHFLIRFWERRHWGESYSAINLTTKLPPSPTSKENKTKLTFSIYFEYRK